MAIFVQLNIFRSIPPNAIDLNEEIGSGTEATVYKARWNGDEVAVKRFKGVPNPKEFQRELSIMSLMHHPNLLRCYGGYADTHKDVYYLVMDRMDTDLHHALKSQAEDPEHCYYRIGFGEALKMALAMSRGLEHLHNCGLIHRDLKSVNMLIDKNYNVKLCDFGLSRVVATKKGNNMTGNVGTVSWIAPEVFENQPYDSKADIYSFGIIMWELYTKQTPFSDVNAFEIPIAVIRGDRPPIPKEMPKDYAKLMKQCWNGKPSKRPTASKIVKELTKMTQIRLFSRSPMPMLGKASMGGSAGNLLQRLAPALTRRAESDRPLNVVEKPQVAVRRSGSIPSVMTLSGTDASSDESGGSWASQPVVVTADSDADVDTNGDGNRTRKSETNVVRSTSPPPVRSASKESAGSGSESPSGRRRSRASSSAVAMRATPPVSEEPIASPSKASLRAKALLGKTSPSERSELKPDKSKKRMSGGGTMRSPPAIASDGDDEM